MTRKTGGGLMCRRSPRAPSPSMVSLLFEFRVVKPLISTAAVSLTASLFPSRPFLHRAHRIIVWLLCRWICMRPCVLKWLARFLFGLDRKCPTQHTRCLPRCSPFARNFLPIFRAQARVVTLLGFFYCSVLHKCTITHGLWSPPSEVTVHFGKLLNYS